MTDKIQIRSAAVQEMTISVRAVMDRPLARAFALLELEDEEMEETSRYAWWKISVHQLRTAITLSALLADDEVYDFRVADEGRRAIASCFIGRRHFYGDIYADVAPVNSLMHSGHSAVLAAIRSRIDTLYRDRQ